MAGPRDPVAGGDGLRVSHADREEVVEALKDAFVHGRLTRDEFGTRAGQALAARTRADLAALTADLPPALAGPASIVPAPAVPAPAVPAPAVPAPTVPARSSRLGPVARAAIGSASCLAFSFAVFLIGSLFDTPDPSPSTSTGVGPNHGWIVLCIFVGFAALIVALGIAGHGLIAWEERRSQMRRQAH